MIIIIEIPFFYHWYKHSKYGIPMISNVWNHIGRCLKMKHIKHYTAMKNIDKRSIWPIPMWFLLRMLFITFQEVYGYQIIEGTFQKMALILGLYDPTCLWLQV